MAHMSSARNILDDEEDEVLAELNRVDEVLREGGTGAGELVGGEFQFDDAAIIPFNLSATQNVNISHEDEEESEENLFDVTPDMLGTLKNECGSYIDNLEHTLSSTFQADNKKLARRLNETSTIPLAFLYMRALQAALKETGHLDVQREKRILFNLRDLYEVTE